MSTELQVHEATGSQLTLIDSGIMTQCMDLARVMSQSSLLPEHLTKSGGKQFTDEQIQANCFRIINQALRWEVDPFALVDETYVVHGKLAYQGKLVMAIVNTRAGLVDGGLRFEFNDATGDDLAVTVYGTFRGGRTETITCSVKDKKTGNEMWKKNPRQKLCYTGSVEWARRHCPQVIMGILTTEDAEYIEGSVVEPKTKVVLGNESPPETAKPKKEPIDMDAFAEHVYACKTLAQIDKAEKALDSKELTEEQRFACDEYLRIARERIAK